MKKIRISIAITVISLLAVLPFTSCVDKNIDVDYETIVLPDIRTLYHDTLNVQIIPVNTDNALAQKIYLVNDSIAAVVKHPKSGNFLDVVNVRSGDLIASKFGVGEGPDEMLFFNVNCDGHEFNATDFVRSRFIQFPVDSLINPSFSPEFIGYPYDAAITSPPSKVGDSLLLINPLRYVNKTHNINQNVEPFIKVAANQQSIGDISMPALFTQNVGQSSILRNPQTGDIWQISLEKSVVEIYDSTLCHKKDLVFPSDVSEDANVVIEDTEVGKCVTYKGASPLAFIESVLSPDKQTVYLCLLGKNIGLHDYEEDMPVHILVMNWEGELLDTFFVPYYISSLSVLDSGLYATIDDAEEGCILVKLLSNEN